MADAENEFSMNWTMTDIRGITVQLTVRRPKLEDWPTAMKEREKIMAQAQKDGWSYPGTVKAVVSAPSPAVAAQPAPANGGSAKPLDWHGESFSFQASTLEASITNGKTYWKVKGGRFTQYGVTIWPENLAEAGLKPDPLKTTDLTGWTAHYITKPDGKPDKVIKLVAPASEQPF